MKQTLAVTLFLIINVLNLQAQVFVKSTTIGLFKPGHQTTGLFLGETTAKAIKVFGQPSRMNDEYLESDDDTAKVFYYGENRLVFTGNSLISFVIKKPTISIGKANGPQFRVGDKIKAEIPKSFYGFNLNVTAGTFDNLVYKSSSVGYLRKDSVNIDKSVALYFDTNNALVRLYVNDL
jgi:hypothetical protein